MCAGCPPAPGLPGLPGHIQYVSAPRRLPSVAAPRAVLPAEPESGVEPLLAGRDIWSPLRMIRYRDQATGNLIHPEMMVLTEGNGRTYLIDHSGRCWPGTRWGDRGERCGYCAHYTATPMACAHVRVGRFLRTEAGSAPGGRMRYGRAADDLLALRWARPWWTWLLRHERPRSRTELRALIEHPPYLDAAIVRLVEHEVLVRIFVQPREETAVQQIGALVSGGICRLCRISDCYHANLATSAPALPLPQALTLALPRARMRPRGRRAEITFTGRRGAPSRELVLEVLRIDEHDRPWPLRYEIELYRPQSQGAYAPILRLSIGVDRPTDRAGVCTTCASSCDHAAVYAALFDRFGPLSAVAPVR